jgi:ketosteroid isomerase-like protein
MVTFDTVIRFPVKHLMKAIVDGVGDPAKLRPLFRIAHDPRLQVTGGELKALGDRFLLVFGHRFDGAYTINLRDYNKLGGMQQHYTQKIRVFTLDDDLDIKNFEQADGGYDSSLPYNRRDLNVVETILADGKTPGLVALGGVFKAGQVAGQLTPIDMVPGTANAPVQVTWVKGFQQALNHYDCARLTLYQGDTSDTFVVLFGGISQYHYDKLNGRLVKDKVDLAKFIDGLPFIDTISVLRRDKNGEYAQYIWPRRLPGLIGAEARFFAVPSAPCFENGVVKLVELKGRTLIGHLFGGIEASEPYSVLPGGGTTASGRLFKVWVTPGKHGVLPMPPLPAEPKPASTAIKEGNAALMAAFAKGDPVAAAAVYSEDGALFPPGKAPVVGRKAIEAFWRDTMTAGIRSLKLSTDEVKSSGQLAYEVGRYELAGADGRMIDAGNYCVVWQRLGATWKLHRDIWNSMRDTK